MALPTAPDAAGTSTRPYLIRALHEWCTDNGYTPYLAVHVDASVRVPLEYVKNREIVLNVGFEATSSLTLGNEFIEFKARFGGVSREIMVPVTHVVAIYARENGQGMAFPAPSEAAVAPPADAGEAKPAAPHLTLADNAAKASARTAPAPAAPTPSSGSATEPSPEPPEPTPPARPALKRIK